MSKISKSVENVQKVEKEKPVINYMGGISYEINPLDTLKMISASSIFGEPAYYRDGIREGSAYINKLVEPYSIFQFESDSKTSDVMIEAINKALDYDFKATLEWASELRNDFLMRLNPQIIMVLASIHPKRAEFTAKYPGLFNEINKKVMKRADEPSSQLAMYIYVNGSKKNLPSVLKRSWAEKISGMKRYEMAKYKNHELGLINTIRICHAKSPLVDELMKNGTIEVQEDEKTWENLRSAGKTWTEILNTITLPHMALLRNLKNIFVEIDDKAIASKVLTQLTDGVKDGKQFPFRYYTALKRIEHDNDVNLRPLIVDALEKCIDIAVENMPKIKGKTISLSDNSGSAWGAIPSEYGSVTVAEIGNLSSVITGISSDEGYVGIFGNKLEITPISKRNGVLAQTKDLSSKRKEIGSSTENGIWLFFKEAIEKNESYDNIFIYSDMQAGHGGLYGIGDDYVIDKESFKAKGHGNYIDVMALIKKYRESVNPKVNIFCIQTAGYDNVLIPEYTYRGAVLYGWTGKEPIFANEIAKQWDDIENRKKANEKN